MKMKKTLLLSALLIFACSSELFCQDYMKMNKKNLRVEYQKKLNQIDSLKKVLDLTYSENQNLQSNLNNANSDLLSISDSLKNSKNELSRLGFEIDHLVRKVSDKNLQIDSLRNSLIDFYVAKDSLKLHLTIARDSIEMISLENEQLINNTLNSDNRSRGVTYWKIKNNVEPGIANKITIQNNPLEITICARSKSFSIFDKVVVEGHSIRLKKRGNIITMTGAGDGTSARFLLYDDMMTMEVFEDGKSEGKKIYIKTKRYSCN